MNNELTSILKNIILSNNLVDSGKLLNSTYVDITFGMNITINIHTTDYFIYLYERYDIINGFLNDPQVGIIIEKEISTLLEVELSNIISGIQSTSNVDIFNMDITKIIVLINGR